MAPRSMSDHPSADIEGKGNELSGKVAGVRSRYENRLISTYSPGSNVGDIDGDEIRLTDTTVDFTIQAARHATMSQPINRPNIRVADSSFIPSPRVYCVQIVLYQRFPNYGSEERSRYANTSRFSLS